MPSRLKRYQTEGHNHFLTFSCYQRLPHLDGNGSCTIFLQTLERLRRKHHFYLFAYVLMPEHVHLLLSEPRSQQLDSVIRVLKGQTSKLLKGGRPKFSYSTSFPSDRPKKEWTSAVTATVRDNGDLTLAVGDRIRHTDFGEGRVTDVTGTGSKSLAEVQFDTAGRKRLLIKIAPIEKL